MGKRTRWAVLGVIASVMAIGAVPQASASHWAGYATGDWQVVFSRCNLNSTVNWAVQGHLDHDVDDLPEGPATTDIDAVRLVSCVYDDVVISDYNIQPEPTVLLGVTTCIEWHDPDTQTNCNYMDVAINLGNDKIPENSYWTLGGVSK